MARNYLSGKIRCAEFALTNTCIAKCPFCNIWKQKPKVFADTEKSLRAIDRMAALGVSHITFTGGEPLLHPDIVQLAERASQHKIHIAVLDAAPALLLKNDMPRRLADAGCDMVTISFDSGDPDTMARSRRIPDIMEDMKKAVAAVKRTGLNVMASILIWNDNYNRLAEAFDRAVETGFDFISLNYPTFSDSPVYELGGEGINFSKGELIQGLESAVALKKTGRYKIINTSASMKNIINFFRDPASAKFPCLGGSRVMFVDWFLNVYPCMQLAEPMGNILEMTEKDFTRPVCNQCGMSWYRDFSLFFRGFRSLPRLAGALMDSAGII
jgi:MoaA/NifB/PqqE/SkfB family radical SAM enzyme